jgi:hypothetical protein
VFLLVLGFALPANADSGRDRHAGYYYPPPSSHETYEARADASPQATALTRIGFVTALANGNDSRPYAPPIAVFAKGAEAEKLIMVALEDGRLDTIYRARAVLAQMTASARLLPALREVGAQERYTFLDLLKILGFSQLTVSNGRDFAHQIIID